MDIFTLQSKIRQLEERANEIAYEMIEADGDRAGELEEELEEVENELDIHKTNLEEFEGFTHEDEGA